VGDADPAPASSKLSKEELYLLSNFTDAGPAAGHEDPLFVDEAGVSSSYRAFIQAARRHLHDHDSAGAEGCLNNAIVFNPYEMSAYRILGELYARQRRYDEIWTLFMEGLRINPNESIVFFFFLNSLSRLLRDDPRARERFELASRDKDSSLAGHLLLYDWHLRHGQAGAAGQVLKRLLARNPDQARLYATLGRRCLSQGRRALAERFFARAEAIRLGNFNAMLYGNYQKLIAELSARRIQLVCMQYPMRSVEPLKKMLRQYAGIIFVDNERAFKDAVERDGYERYFSDDFGGDFGHCTREGNRLLAEHLAEAILAYRRRGHPLPEP
jgi:tetratricopeptide (TPR) repeat protein